jgi:hypothetical protein
VKDERDEIQARLSPCYARLDDSPDHWTLFDALWDG